MLLLCLAWAVLYLPALGLADLEFEEPRRAQVARNMLETGDWLVPRYLGGIYLAKPPLFNWAIAAASLPAGGISALTARLPSALSLLGLAVAMVWMLRRWMALPGLACLGLSLLLAPELMLKGTLAEIDALFTTLVAVSLWAWATAWASGRRGAVLWLPPLGLAALGFLAKGPPGPVFLYLSVVPFLLVRRELEQLLNRWHFAGLGLFLVLAGGWVAAVIDRVGLDTLVDTVNREMVGRGLGRTWEEAILHGLTYPLELFAALLPFSLLTAMLAWRSVRERVRAAGPDLYTFAWASLLANLPIYLTRDSAVRYFLPALPSALVLAALVFDRLWRSAELSSGALRARLAGTRAIGLLMLGLAVTLGVFTAQPAWHADSARLLPWPLGVAVAAAAAAVALAVLWQSRARTGPVLLAGLAGTMVVVRGYFVLVDVPETAREYRTVRNAPAVMHELAQRVPEEMKPVVVVGEIPRELYFYAPHGLLSPPAPRPSGPDVYLDFVRGVENPAELPGGVEEAYRVPYGDEDGRRGELRVYYRPD